MSLADPFGTLTKKVAVAPSVARPLTMEEQAAQVAAAMIDPQVAAINRQVQEKQQGLVGSQQAYAGVIDALGRLTAGMPGAVQGAYQQAGDRTAGYASGLTGALGDQAKAIAAQVADHLASLGAPGSVQTTSPEAMNVTNYQYGALPGASLAAEAASRLGEFQGLRAAGGYALGQGALQAMRATQQEINDLQARGLDIENTRPGEVQKALAGLRDEARANAQLAIQEQNFKLQAKAAGAQEKQIDRAWYQTLSTEAWNRTNATGTLWTVGRNGKLVNTGKAAPGSAAGRASLSAAVSAAAEQGRNKRAKISAAVQRERIREQRAHNRVNEGIANARLGISQQEADTAVKREQAYERYQAGKTKGKTGIAGMSNAEVRQYSKRAGQITHAFFYGVPNPKYVDPKTGKPVAGQSQYATKPQSAADTMKAMLAEGIPYSIAWKAIYQYATTKNSQWSDALKWNPKYKPPSKRK